MWKTQILHHIQWKYIEDLNILQVDVGFILAKKTEEKTHHVDQTQNKINVSLIAQTLSASVASSIDFLRGDIHLSDFEDSLYTTDFQEN